MRKSLASPSSSKMPRSMPPILQVARLSSTKADFVAGRKWEKAARILRPFSFLHYDAADLFIREMILFKLKKFLVAITAILFLSPATAMAEDLTITAFKGNWRGKIGRASCREREKVYVSASVRRDR